MIICQITNREFRSLKCLATHIGKNLKTICSIKKYYDLYLKKDNEGKCYFCNNDALFINLIKGYKRICNEKRCIGWTRATGTHEYLMYKYGYTKEEALIEQKRIAIGRGKKIKERFDKEIELNPLYNHERSPKTKEFWLKKGYSEEESIKEVSLRMKNVYETSIKKRKENPNYYSDCYPNQLKYWLKLGFLQEEAEAALKERQAVGRLDKFIERYGEEEGIKRWKERQIKWKKSLNDNNQLIEGTQRVKGSELLTKFSKISQELFDVLDKKFINNNFYYAVKNKEYFISLPGNKYYLYDFVDTSNMKIIEFNGDIYHGNPNIFESTDKPNPFRQDLTCKDIWESDEIKINAAINKGFKVLIIWECDYRNNKSKTIQECIKFLNKK